MSWSHLTSHDRVVLPRVPGCPQASLSLWEAGPVVPSPGRREVPAQDHTALVQSLARPGMLVCNSQLPRMCPPLCPWEGKYWGGYIMGSASRAFVPALICSRDSEGCQVPLAFPDGVFMNLVSQRVRGRESGLEICPPQWDPPPPAQVPPLPATPPP